MIWKEICVVILDHQSQQNSSKKNEILIDLQSSNRMFFTRVEEFVNLLALHQPVLSKIFSLYRLVVFEILKDETKQNEDTEEFDNAVREMVFEESQSDDGDENTKREKPTVVSDINQNTNPVCENVEDTAEIEMEMNIEEIKEAVKFIFDNIGSFEIFI